MLEYSHDNLSEQALFDYLNLVNKNFQRPVPFLKGYSRKLFENAYLFIARMDREVVGLVAMYANNFDTKECYISSVSVKICRKGIATNLLANAISFASQEGFKSILLEVDDVNTPAISLYEKLGFVKIGPKEKGISSLMRKNL